MRAHRIIDGAAFGPEVLAVVRQGFDDAWNSVASKFLPHEHELAREILAMAMMSATRDNSVSVAVLRDAGIRAVQARYPARFSSDPISGQSGTNG